MSRTIRVAGRLIDRTTLKLETPAPEGVRTAEAVLQVDDELRRRRLLSEVVRSLPPGQRSREEIDRQIDDDRS